MRWRESGDHAGTDIRCAWCGRRPDGPVVYMPIRYCSSECTAAGELRKNLCNAPILLVAGVVSVLFVISDNELLLLLPALLFLSFGGYSLYLVGVGYANQDKRNIYLDPDDDSQSWPYACVWCGMKNAQVWLFDGAMRPYCSLSCRSTENIGWNACLAILAFVGSGFSFMISMLPTSMSTYLLLFAVLLALVGVYLFYAVVLGIRALDKRVQQIKENIRPARSSD